MAHFFKDGSGATTPVTLLKLGAGRTARMGLWGADINGQALVPSINNSGVAIVTGNGTSQPDGTIRGITVQALAEGNFVLEGHLGRGGPVWAVAPGVVGKKDSDISPVALQAIAVARQELKAGVFEDDNNNTGARVDQYESVFGLHGVAWCAMFVYWCFKTAAESLKTANPMPKIAGAANLLQWGQQHDKIIAEPAGGDILIVKPGRHVGLVTGVVNAQGKVPSIEGNTWAHGTEADHKDGVYEKTHALDSCFYLRP